MPTAEEIRAGQREIWGKFSAGWEKWDDVVVSSIASVADAMIGALQLSGDQHHLEVAAGTGEPGLSIAALVPNGNVTLTDLSPEMLAVAQRRAESRGLTNVAFEECGAEDLPFPDASFDSVGCRFGFMFIPDMAKAIAEFVRVLKPGGRACIAVWAGPEHNPWTTVPMVAVMGEVQMPPPDPDAPSMFRCAAPGAMADRFRAAGLRDVAEAEVGTAMVTDSPERYWQLVQELTPPVVMALQQVDQAARDRVSAKVIEDAKAFQSADGKVKMPGMARVIVGTK